MKIKKLIVCIIAIVAIPAAIPCTAAYLLYCGLKKLCPRYFAGGRMVGLEKRIKEKMGTMMKKM